MTKYPLLLIACAACGSPPAASSSTPWLRGMTPVAVTEVPTQAAAERLATIAGEPDELGALELRADIARAPGDETVLASYSQGVAVLDANGHVIAKAPGQTTEGSADDVVSLAVGEAGIGSPVIVLAVNRGGHRESTTSLVLYRVGAKLEPVFSAPVEEHEGSDTWSGSVTMFPNGLVYRAPRRTTSSLWMYDSRRGRYVEQAVVSGPAS